MKTTGAVKLVLERLRLVEVTGPTPDEWRRPTLKLDDYGRDGRLPQSVGFCVRPGQTSRS